MEVYVELHPEAEAELDLHAEFYERKAAGLGVRFVLEVEAGFSMLISQPRIGRLLDESFRSFVLAAFPISLIYRIDPEKIWIVAIAHQSKRPGFWRNRSG